MTLQSSDRKRASCRERVDLSADRPKSMSRFHGRADCTHSNQTHFAAIEESRNGVCCMAERQAITPREDRRPVRSRGWAEPFGMMQRFADEVDRMFEDFGFGRRFGLSSHASPTGMSGVWAPEIEVFQKGDQLTIRADLPGLKKDEVSVDIADSALTIHGERKREHEEEREGVYRSERSYGSFYRTIPLPEGAITEQAKAQFRDGVLEITLPTPPASKGRRLEITEVAKK
jgi:HSP20 family protein